MNIRNFSIIAHIDHGKSTLADRFIQLTNTIPDRQMKAQFLDGMELERERGITIKAKAVRMLYTADDGEEYVLNLIDTPGHVDFSYEVSRAMAACEGAILLVDASQGVEAQTLAHAHLAQSLGLAIIPVMNKIDLEHSNPDATEEQIWEVLRNPVDTSRISAKDGRGVREVLERVIKEIPAPAGTAERPLRALVFDSFYDVYKGVIIYTRVVDGSISAGKYVSFHSSGATYKVEEVGYLTPKLVKSGSINTGEVGYIIAGIRDIHEIKMGDTLFEKGVKIDAPLSGYKEVNPVVFAGFYPVSTTDYTALKAAIEKLNLTDSSFNFQGETSKALGFGFRLGFMGLLHLDIIRERIEREFNIPLIATNPNVIYKVLAKSKHGGKEDKYVEVTNPADFPHYGDVMDIKEPYVLANIIAPLPYMEGIMNLLKEKRGEHIKIEYISTTRVIVEYYLPLSEIILDFYDRLKSVSRGYASFDYEPYEYRSSDMVKIEILLHAETVDALSFIVHRAKALHNARILCEKLKELIPRHMFEIAVQAQVGGKIIARETIGAIRKDVLAKCYGGDITRKRKLLEAQKEGKRKMKLLGSVEIPQEAFMSLLKISQDR
ncbi:MAG: elongation factor 4 [Elusimicrobia bacterium CG_4_10_14_0_2_um_filter_56_8]|nr:MAG: elongation factor 4 [Elusimicrobia bacterium CG1_02_56_21]PJA12224.1 MAG: elongation factor 4 [Elusimicrobia bacterium CG_4_10_14_0_2_um_filter_56_8]